PRCPAGMCGSARRQGDPSVSPPAPSLAPLCRALKRESRRAQPLPPRALRCQYGAASHAILRRSKGGLELSDRWLSIAAAALAAHEPPWLEGGGGGAPGGPPPRGGAAAAGGGAPRPPARVGARGGR